MGLCTEKGSLVEVFQFPTCVAGIGCDEADRAMRGLAVVPIGKPLYPGLCLHLGCKTPCRPVRSVLAGAE